MMGIFSAMFLFVGINSQTLYTDRQFFKLTVSEDGRVEALINAHDPKWMTVYRQFLEMNRDTGELMIAFDVAASEYPSVLALKSESHIMMTTISSGKTAWEFSKNVTSNKQGYIHSNMVLWYDTYSKQMVMVYQSSSYWHYSTLDNEYLQKYWAGKTDLDAYDQILKLTRMTTQGAAPDEKIWSDPVQILHNMENPHVHYQFIESIDKNDEGYSKELLIPVHHLSESSTEDNYEMIARTERTLDPTNDWTITKIEKTEDAGQGMLQASIIRVPRPAGGYQLIAFMRDAYGYWIRRSISDDDGYSWSDPIETALPNPDQMSQAIYLHSGMVMLIYNPSQSMSTEPNRGDRYANAHHLAVGLSADYGLTWQYSRMLEYAYDGMFNYPVGMQDPNCDNIYLTYSVETSQKNGCTMLKECTDSSQNSMSYIKFTILTEAWVLNDFEYTYDTSNKCMWQLANSIRKPPVMSTSDMQTATFNTAAVSTESKKMTTVIILSIVLGVLGVVNTAWCYFLCLKRNLRYADLEATNENNIKEYETTN